MGAPRKHGNTRVRRAKSLRSHALKRVELRQPTEARRPAAGVTSFPVKDVDEASRAAIEAFLQRGRQ